jgi:hypothetical protein
MEIMEIQEEISQCSEDDLGKHSLDNKDRIQQSVDTIGRLFDEERLEECQKEAIKLNYWYTIQRLIDDRL